MILAIHNFASLVKFSHTVFALPFAMSMFVIIKRGQSYSLLQILFILLALVSARTAAMTFNRLIDRDIDAKNSRTANREIPSGKVSVVSARLLLLVSSLLFFLSSYLLGTHCLILSPLVLAVLFFYSWTKRFTSFSHVVLGITLALAPGGVWYALTARFAIEPVYLMIAVMLWVAGFDIIYSTQDIDFDKTQKLYSIPAKLGVSKSLILSRILHFISFLFLLIFGFVMNMQIIYYLGVYVFGMLLVSQHLVVTSKDISAADGEFFTKNGLASVLFFVFTLADCVLS